MEQTTKTIVFGDTVITFSTEPELKMELIQSDFPNGLPPGEGPFDII